MAQADKSLGSVAFGPFELFLDTQELRKHGVPVKLSGQAIQVLIVLIARPGQLVTREELQQKLWPGDSFGDFEHGLNAAVNKLREKLGDSATTPKYIETLPGRGYRFIGKIESEKPQLYVLEPAHPKLRRKLKAAIPGTVVALVVGAAVLIYFWSRPEPMPKVSNYVQLTHDGQQKRLVGTDGSRLYLGLGFYGGQGVAQMPISGGEPTTIPVSSPNVYPSDVSPDGSRLLVNGMGAGRAFWSLPVLGGFPLRLGDAEGQEGAWSADGKMLAYCRVNELFVAKADGTESRKLVTIKDVKRIWRPVWSPDGTHLRFDSSSPSDPSSIWEVSVDGTELHRLLLGWHHPSGECCGKWTVDGRYFIFQSDSQIWALPRRDRFFRSEPKPVQLTFSPLWLSTAIPGKDGKKLFVVGRTLRGQLMRFDAKSGQFSPFLGGISAEFVAFSKDGQWVAYVSYPEGTLWRSKADGSQRLQLTLGPTMSPCRAGRPTESKFYSPARPPATSSRGSILPMRAADLPHGCSSRSSISSRRSCAGLAMERFDSKRA